MAYKQIRDLASSGGNLLDEHLIEGQAPDGVETKKYTGLEVRAVEKAEREDADALIADAVGLDEDLNFIPYSGTEYLDAATTIAEAIEELDAGVKRDAMLKSVYDPREQEADCFDMDNMREGDTNKILTNDTQTIAGVKTFVSLPESDNEPTTDYQLVNKRYVDDAVADSDLYLDKATYDPNDVAGDVFDMDNMAEGNTNKILTNAGQSIKGIKEFESFPVVPDANPSSDKEVANKKYVDYVFSAAKREAETQIASSVGSSGTLPTTSNTDNIIEIQLTDVETPSSIFLGSHAALKEWRGNAAEYAAVATKDSNTLYYIYE